jgi:hypothetical protein
MVTARSPRKLAPAKRAPYLTASRDPVKKADPEKLQTFRTRSCAKSKRIASVVGSTLSNDVLVPMPKGGTVPLAEVASVKLTRGPTTIRTENGRLAVYVFVDIRDRDLGGYVAEAQKAVAASVVFPPGYYVTWSGQFEYLERAAARLKVVVPVTLQSQPVPEPVW